KTVLSSEKISISGGLLQIADASTIGGTVEILNNGTLQTNSQLTLSGTVDWISGTLTDTGSSSITITGTTNLTGNGTILDTTLINQGTLNNTGSAALTLTSATLVNDNPGTIDIQNDISITATGSTLQNKGLLKKSAGANTTTLPAGLNLDSTGSVEVYSGTLKVNSTSQLSTDVNSIKTLTAGKWKVQGGTLDLAPVNSLRINNAEIIFGVGGSITGIETFTTNNGTVRFLDNSARNLGNFTNQTSGIIELGGTGSLFATGNNRITNLGTIKKTGSGTASIYTDNGFDIQSGTLRVESGILQLGTNITNQSIGDWSSVTFQVLSGAIVDITGRYNLRQGTFSATGSGTVKLRGTFQVPNFGNIQSSTLQFPEGLLLIDGGSIQGTTSFQITNSGFLSIGPNGGSIHSFINQGNILVQNSSLNTNLQNDTL
ncbi:hypothetical protein EBX93_17095, partial [bacterium]|nr:hypothetical protein [bacterium]